MAASRGHRVPPAMEEMLGHRSLIRSAIQWCAMWPSSSNSWGCTLRHSQALPFISHRHRLHPAVLLSTVLVIHRQGIHGRLLPTLKLKSKWLMFYDRTVCYNDPCIADGVCNELYLRTVWDSSFWGLNTLMEVYSWVFTWCNIVGAECVACHHKLTNLLTQLALLPHFIHLLYIWATLHVFSILYRIFAGHLLVPEHKSNGFMVV
jgi:hypothetical protein